MNYVLKIVGDTNDGDSETSKRTFELDDLYLEAGDIFPNSPEVKLVDFATALGDVLKTIETRHNWSRDEFDSPKYAIRTTERLLYKLFNLSDELIEERGYDYGSVIDTLKEAISDLLPYGEFGIHTIWSIEYYPAPPKPDSVSLYKRD